MGRRIKHVRLGDGHARARTLEAQLDTKMVEGRKRCTQHRRRGPIATQLFHLLFARGSRESEFHERLTEVGSQCGASFRSGSHSVRLAPVALPALPRASIEY